MFRKCIKTDLNLSDRLKRTGLEHIFLDVLRYSFSGEPFLPPVKAHALIEKLYSTEHSLCRIKIRGT